jgi:hypothetical protein
VKFPIDFPPAKKALGIALVAVVAYVIVEGTGIGAAPKQLVGAFTSQVKNFFARLMGGASGN